MKKILYLTDLFYNAKGRNYYEEDLFIIKQLKEDFNIAMCHPKDAQAFEDNADLIVFRNTGSVILYQEEYDNFKSRIKQKGLLTFNEFIGKADMNGKQYLIELTEEKYPVIPTIDNIDDFKKLPKSDYYIIKPKGGADSIGLEKLSKNELLNKNIHGTDMLIEPAVDFEYEVSFYFINDCFEYAMYAPDPSRRWELKEYTPSEEDIQFARKFIEWNDINHGIQRVDACRTKNGELLLVELEDLNPFLSLQNTSVETQTKFITDLKKAFFKLIDNH